MVHPGSAISHDESACNLLKCPSTDGVSFLCRIASVTQWSKQHTTLSPFSEYIVHQQEYIRDPEPAPQQST